VLFRCRAGQGVHHVEGITNHAGQYLATKDGVSLCGSNAGSCGVLALAVGGTGAMLRKRRKQ